MAQIELNVGKRKVQHFGIGDGTSLPSGPYKAKYVSDKINANGNLEVTVEVAEGEHAGTKRRITVGLDFTKEGNQNTAFTLLKSLGFSDGEIDDSLNVDTEQVFYGRDCFIGNRAKDPNAAEGSSKAYDEVKFIAQEDYDKMLEAMAGGEEAAAPAPETKKPTLGAKTLGGPKNEEKKPAATVAPAPGATGGLKGLLQRNK